ncbi:DUF2971 domain-containing protein [Aeromonas caviae]|uniref:DUF2971 domain-containing protein n=1 Tax=Aeromonas caviae TaxID=648 RepID=UPI003F74981F
MRKLYKYYKSLELDYFSNPSFKLSSARTLNDPFETVLASELLATMETVIDKKSLSYNAVSRLLGEEANLKDTYDTLFKMCGIVSLSETQHNLLMWSHYADQHKGLCIGYHSNLLSKMKFPNSLKLPITKEPLKINYDNKKTFDYEFDFDYRTDNKLINSILRKVLTTKGDDWIYEKEHRFIIPVNFADRLRIYKNGSLENEIEYYKDKKTRYEEKNKIQRFRINSAIESGYSYLLDINPEDITDVYLGCKMPPRKAKAIRKNIKENPITKHIQVYKFKESDERFEIILDESF